MKTYTHVGASKIMSRVHMSSRMYGHGDYAGKTHALNGSSNIYTGGQYKAVCGAAVRAEHDGDCFNVRPATPESRITCKRCKKQIA